MLKIKDLTVVADEKQILDNFSLDINEGEIVALMGPNGVGKSTICKVLLNDLNYKVKKGTIEYNGKNINKLDTTSRAKLGLYLLSQNPISLPGIKNSEMLRIAIGKDNEQIDILKFHKELKEVCQKIELPDFFIHRDINDGMSGGEKKKNELMHMWMLKPRVLILDEVDSGLDVDAFKIVINSIKDYYEKYQPMILVITHNPKVFNYLKPNKVAILANGKIISEGNEDLLKVIEEKGFESFKISENKVYE